MNNAEPTIYSTRSIVIFELPLPACIGIFQPEQIVLKIGKHSIDIGSLCFAERSSRSRKCRGGIEVNIDSFMAKRSKAIGQVIGALNQMNTDGGISLATVFSYAMSFKHFLDWADLNGFHECLSERAKLEPVYEAWCINVRERLLRHEISVGYHNILVKHIAALAKTLSGCEGMTLPSRTIKNRRGPDASTEPLRGQDFSHALALNQAIFDGFCALVLEKKRFPYHLQLPASLGWPGRECSLWVFPDALWSLPPHLWGRNREAHTKGKWAYDYVNGRLATVEEIAHRYVGSGKIGRARKAIFNAQVIMDKANYDVRHWTRLMFGALAFNAFIFLFFANTGVNEAVAWQIESDGKLDSTTLNQNFRSIKFRAHGKPIALETSVAFLPTLRRFMELRHWLLQGAEFKYLFFTLGSHWNNTPAQILFSPLVNVYWSLRRIDPKLPKLGARRIRATFGDFFRHKYDSSVAALLLQNSDETAQRHYNVGSVLEHRAEMSLFLEKVAENSNKQLIQKSKESFESAKPLEEGGLCTGYGHPKAIIEGLTIQPDCKQGQGCIFCQHRILVASEEDARKVASAAFVMEQLILGPLHEAELRPLICKCDADLEQIADFPGCREMVSRVKREVFEGGKLTAFFADKFQLFLELGIIV